MQNYSDQNSKREILLQKRHNIKVIALDCDGVLFDSKDANVLFYTHIMEVVGLPPIRTEQHEYIHMHPVRQSLQYLIGNEGEIFEKAYTYFKTIDFGPFNCHLKREPGLIEFLSAAQSLFKTALATNRTVSTLELLRRYDLNGYFDLVVSASDVENPKPHPEIMERIFAAFEVTPDEVLYVGDSRVDEVFAQATGVIFVGYKNPGLIADFHVNHFQELDFLFGNLSADGASS